MTSTSSLASGENVPGVNFYGPTGVVISPGTAARGYLAGLRAAAVPVSLVPLHEIFTHEASVGHVERGQRPRHPIAIVQTNADSVHRFLHFHGRSFARARYRIGIWVWELPAFRDDLWTEFRHFDEIWTPSTFSQRSIQAVTAKSVIVMPHVISAAAPQAGSRDEFKIGRDEFMFLYVFDATSMVARKNPYCLVDAFEAAFAQHDRVRLVLKVTNADKDPELSRYLAALEQRNGRCLVLRQHMETRELAGLFGAADCYVSPHRTEGFGLTVAEAMALGVPVIATDYGGTVDFLTEDVGFPLRYRLVEIDRSHGPYAKGAIWPDPSREHLQELLRYVVANPRAASAKGVLAQKRIIKEYSAEAIGRRMRERLVTITVT